jgi:hypothetical protein
MEYTLRLETGAVVVVDPSYLHHANKPNAQREPILENAEFRNAQGRARLLVLESAALLSTGRDDLDAIGYCELRDFKPGRYRFKLSDISEAGEPGHREEEVASFSVDTGQVLVFDIKHLDAMLRTFDWKRAYLRNGQVDRVREKKWAVEIGGSEDTFVQVQSPGVNRGVAFVGDGEYLIRGSAFIRVQDSPDQKPRRSLWQRIISHG